MRSWPASLQIFLCLQLELRDLKSGSRQNERLRSYDQVEVVRLEQQSYTYLYEEGGACVGVGGCRSIIVWSAHESLNLFRCSRVYVGCTAVTASLCSPQTSLWQAFSSRLHEHIAQGLLCCAFLQLHAKDSGHGWGECAFRSVGLHCASPDAACKFALHLCSVYAKCLKSSFPA